MSTYLAGILSRHFGSVPVLQPRTSGYFGPPRPHAVWPAATQSVDASPTPAMRGPSGVGVARSARESLRAAHRAMPAEQALFGAGRPASVSPAGALPRQPAERGGARIGVTALEDQLGDRANPADGADGAGIPVLANAATEPAARPVRRAPAPPRVGPRGQPSRLPPPAVATGRTPTRDTRTEPRGLVAPPGGVLQPVQARVAPYADRKPAVRRIHDESSAEEADHIEVTIGRVEVRAVPPTAARLGPSPTTATATMTLEEYLRRRASGAGR